MVRMQERQDRACPLPQALRRKQQSVSQSSVSVSSHSHPLCLDSWRSYQPAVSAVLAITVSPTLTGTSVVGANSINRFVIPRW